MTTRTSNKAITLQYVKTVGMVNDGDNGRGFANPYDVAIGKTGSIYVINRCDVPRRRGMRIGICTLDEDYLGEFGHGYGSRDGQFTWPVALAFDSQDKLYITDEQTHRISIFDEAGNYQGKWGGFGDEPGQLAGPAGIAIDADDNVYITDQLHRVQKFTTKGELIAWWGGQGNGEGEFNLPWGVTVDSQGNVYVADWRNDRIQKFTPDGQFLDTFGEPGRGDGQFYRPSSVAVDPEGYIYVADWGNERVQVLASDGSFQLKLRGQATLSSWAKDFLDSNLDEKTTREKSNLFPELPPVLQSPYHISAQTEAYFWGPVSVKLDPQGRLYVTETNRGRIQVYQKR